MLAINCVVVQVCTCLCSNRRFQRVELFLPCSIISGQLNIVPICIPTAQRIVKDIGVEIQTLRIAELSVWNGRDFDAPVRPHEAPHVAGVVSSSEVVEAGFGIAFFAGKREGELREAKNTVVVEYACASNESFRLFHRSYKVTNLLQYKDSAGLPVFQHEFANEYTLNRLIQRSRMSRVKSIDETVLPL